MSINEFHFRDFILFAGLEDQELELLKACTVVQRMKKNKFVYLPGDRNANIYLLREGFVKLGTITETGDEMIYNILGAGEIFGHFGLKNEPGEYAQTMADSEMYSIRQSDFEGFLESKPRLSTRFVKIVNERLKKTERKLSHFVFMDSRSRVLEMLQDLGKEGERNGDYIIIENILTHQEIASLTATSRQTVSAILSDLKIKGVINYDRKRIYLPANLSALV